jgi:hypothetical protein
LLGGGESVVRFKLRGREPPEEDVRRCYCTVVEIGKMYYLTGVRMKSREYESTSMWCCKSCGGWGGYPHFELFIVEMSETYDEMFEKAGIPVRALRESILREQE